MEGREYQKCIASLRHVKLFIFDVLKLWVELNTLSLKTQGVHMENLKAEKNPKTKGSEKTTINNEQSYLLAMSNDVQVGPHYSQFHFWNLNRYQNAQMFESTDLVHLDLPNVTRMKFRSCLGNLQVRSSHRFETHRL